MDFIFADDARQQKPSVPGMGPLVAIGGIHVGADHVGPLERELDELCAATGFPDGEEFKWSTGRQTWMRDHLVDNAKAA